LNLENPCSSVDFAGLPKSLWQIVVICAEHDLIAFRYAYVYVGLPDQAQNHV
jgi:hypothetical protein